MTARPLALTSQQLAVVQQHAKSVAPILRDRYLLAIVDNLTGKETTDETVQRAVHAALTQMLGAPCRCCTEVE